MAAVELALNPLNPKPFVPSGLGHKVFRFGLGGFRGFQGSGLEGSGDLASSGFRGASTS